MGISSTCQFCRLSIWLFILFIFCPVSGGGGVIPIIPSIRQCVFLIFDSPGFGDVLMVSYVVSICAFVPFLLPISFQGLLSKLSMEIQGLNSRHRHPWTVLGPEISNSWGPEFSQSPAMVWCLCCHIYLSIHLIM